LNNTLDATVYSGGELVPYPGPAFLRPVLRKGVALTTLRTVRPIAQLLGILAAPGAFFAILLVSLGPFGWQLVGMRYFYISFSMAVMGLIMVFEWDALFPDKRD
jgi:hypothetical protein